MMLENGKDRRLDRLGQETITFQSVNSRSFQAFSLTSITCSCFCCYYSYFCCYFLVVVATFCDVLIAFAMFATFWYSALPFFCFWYFCLFRVFVATFWYLLKQTTILDFNDFQKFWAFKIDSPGNRRGQTYMEQHAKHRHVPILSVIFFFWGSYTSSSDRLNSTITNINKQNNKR